MGSCLAYCFVYRQKKGKESRKKAFEEGTYAAPIDKQGNDPLRLFSLASYKIISVTRKCPSTFFSHHSCYQTQNLPIGFRPQVLTSFCPTAYTQAALLHLHVRTYLLARSFPTGPTRISQRLICRLFPSPFTVRFLPMHISTSSFYE